MDKLSEWENKSVGQRQEYIATLIEQKNQVEIESLINLVRAPGHWGVYASTGPHYTCAIFGRDSLVVAEDLINVDRKLVEDIIITLAKLQGTSINKNNEEEPGKILHEFRAIKLDGVIADVRSRVILKQFQKKWKEETSNEMIYYGSFDSTPLFIRLVCVYVESYGTKLFEQSFIGRDGKHRTTLDSVRLAISWLIDKIGSSRTGLLEYRRQNPRGIENQVWKDSRTSYIHKDGSLPLFDKGIAPIELQAYAYDALIMSAKLVAVNDVQANYWLALAKNLQRNTIDKLWDDKIGYFAQGLEFTSSNKYKKINTVTSDGAAILNSRILDGISPSSKNKMVKNIAKTILSENFLTPAGIRCRSLQHKNIPNFIDYQGSYTIWPKETYAIAKGFRRQGFSLLAQELEDLILQSILAAGEFYEFFCVESDNTVWSDYRAEIVHFAGKSPGGDFQPPEPGQSWTMSAFIKILSSRWKNEVANVGNWEARAAKEISILKSEAIKEILLYS
jgi:glycogen debranching enzyme